MSENRPVICEDCGATFTEKWRWEPSLPSHNCTERATRRREATAPTPQPSPARWVTQPGDDRRHHAGADCPCTPTVWPGGAVDHR